MLYWHLLCYNISLIIIDNSAWSVKLLKVLSFPAVSWTQLGPVILATLPFPFVCSFSLSLVVCYDFCCQYFLIAFTDLSPQWSVMSGRTLNGVQSYSHFFTSWIIHHSQKWQCLPCRLLTYCIVCNFLQHCRSDSQVVVWMCAVARLLLVDWISATWNMSSTSTCLAP